MRKRGLFGLVVTFIHDLITPFDSKEAEKEEFKLGHRFGIRRHASPRSAEESRNWEPAELKHMLEPWDYLSDEEWEKTYRGERSSEDAATLHVFPPPKDRFEGTTVRAFGPNALPNDYDKKVFPPNDFRTRAEPTPESSEKIVVVWEDVVEGDSEKNPNESNSVSKPNEMGADQSNGDDFGSDADNSSDSQGFTEISVPADFSSNYGWANDNAFNDF